MPGLPLQGIAVDGFDLINETVLTASVRAEVIAELILEEFPTECRQVLDITQGFQIDPQFGRFRKWDFVILQK